MSSNQHTRTQEWIVEMQRAATELSARVVSAEREAHESRNMAMRALSSAGAAQLDIEKLRQALRAARTLMDTTVELGAPDHLDSDLRDGIDLADDALATTKDASLDQGRPSGD